jgi:hypothetical protein
MFALGFLGAYSVAALILFFTLRESVAGSGTTPRRTAGPEIISDNADLPPFENYAGNFPPENGKPVAVNDTQTPDPSGPPWDGGFNGDATSSIFRDAATPPANAPPSSFAPNRDPGAGGSPRPFSAGLFTAGFTGGFAGTSGPPPQDLTSVPIDPSDPIIASTGPGIQNVNPPDVPGGGPDVPKPPIDGGPPPGKTDPDPAPVTVSLPEPLTISIFAAGMLGAIGLRRGRKKAAAL